VFALALSAGTGAAAKQTADTLEVNAVFGYSPPGQPPSRVACPTGGPSTDQCFQFSGHAAIRGLGQVTDSFMLTTADDSLACVPLSFTPVVISVGSKGEIDATVGTSGPCDATATTFTITGGTGAFAGVSGAGMFTPNVGLEDDHYIDADDPPDWTQDTWTGTLTVPGATLDITPPVISGAHAKTVVVPKAAKSARVVYTVTAHDDTDGAVPVTCKPRSGSNFKIGHTTVHCSATDSSDNTATASFIITVKHR
jgi:hypothetical protein